VENAIVGDDREQAARLQSKKNIHKPLFKKSL
jgi:hypothetical protein